LSILSTDVARIRIPKLIRPVTCNSRVAMESYTTVPEIDSEKGRRWVPELETVPPAAKELLSTYSQIPEEEMLSHIVETVCLK
jgi:hypothetical protein